MNYQKAARDVIHSDLNQIEAPEWAKSSVGKWAYNLMKDELYKLTNTTNGLFEAFKAPPESQVQSQYTYEAAKSLMNANSIWEAMDDIGIHK